MQNISRSKYRYSYSQSKGGDTLPQFAKIDPQEFAKQDAMASVISNLKTLLNEESAFVEDARRLSSPDNLAGRRNTLRGVGMADCENRFIQSMQSQSFLRYTLCIQLYKADDNVLWNNQSGGKGFEDISYVVQKDDQDNYILQFKVFAAVNYLTKRSSDPSLVDISLKEKDSETVNKERITRDFVESISSYSSVEIVFKNCNKREFDQFFAGHKLMGEIASYNPEDDVYYIPEINSAEYKVYVSPKFGEYSVKYGDENISSKHITLTHNPLDNRLGFIAGSLQDAMSASITTATEDKDKQVKYALISLRELVKSEYVNQKELVDHADFAKIITSSVNHGLSSESKKLLAEFFDDADFRVAVRNSTKAQDLFMNLIVGGGLEEIAYMFAGLSLELTEKVSLELTKKVSPEYDFWAGNEWRKAWFDETQEQSKKFEEREHTLMTIGCVIAGAAIGIGFAVGLTMLAAATFGGAFVLFSAAAYYCRGVKTMKNDSMITIHAGHAERKAEYFMRGGYTFTASAPREFSSAPVSDAKADSSSEMLL